MIFHSEETFCKDFFKQMFEITSFSKIFIRVIKYFSLTIFVAVLFQFNSHQAFTDIPFGSV